MKARRGLRITALTVAGLLSLYLCFIGLVGLLWGGFGRGKDDAQMLGFFLPFLLALPLFVFSLGISRFASLGLWVLIPYHWFWMVIHFGGEGSVGPLGFMKGLALLLVAPTEISIVLLAVLVQFGSQVFNQFSFDEYLYGRTRGKSEPEA
ncbi:MAG: hypothetical protein ABR957_08755 [Terracidiphilus sp.]|jgi:hypothetical protein